MTKNVFIPCIARNPSLLAMILHEKKELWKYLLDEVLGVGKGSPWIKVLNVKADNPVLTIWKKEPLPSS